MDADKDPYLTTPPVLGPDEQPPFPAADRTQIGRYRVIGLLGKGAFGRVFLAEDDELDRRVAIKVPNPERISSPEDLEAYLREAKVLARLEHPNIVPVHDVGRTDERSAPEEVDNLAAAFVRAREAAMKAVHDLAKKAAAEKNWRLEARLAVVVLQLEDDRTAADMCRIDARPDPIQRTIFIDELPVWHGDVTSLASYSQARSEAALVGPYLDHLPSDRSDEVDDGTAQRVDDSAVSVLGNPE